MKIILLYLCVWFGQVSAGEENCPVPALAQGFLVPELQSYKHGSEVSYGCNPGLKSAVKTWWAVIKCENGEWSHNPQCVDVNNCTPPDVPHAKPVQPLQLSYSDNSRVAFTCDKGFEFEYTDMQEAVCGKGEWKLPVCKRQSNSCDAPSHLANAVIIQPYQDVFEHTERVEYQCKKGYKLEGQKHSYCMFSVWTPAPKCVSAQRIPVISKVELCGSHPTVKNAIVSEQQDGWALKVDCVRLHKLVGPEQILCIAGQWSELPVCKAPCKLDPSMLYYSDDEYIEHGTERWYHCSATRRVYIKCDDGKAFYRGCDRNDW